MTAEKQSDAVVGGKKVKKSRVGATRSERSTLGVCKSVIRKAVRLQSIQGRKNESTEHQSEVDQNVQDMNSDAENISNTANSTVGGSNTNPSDASGKIPTLQVSTFYHPHRNKANQAAL